MFRRLRPPSYFCDNETDTGLQLHYRSKRRGFTYYTQGQLKAIAQTFYNQTLEIEVLDSEIVFDTIHVSFKVSTRKKLIRLKLQNTLCFIYIYIQFHFSWPLTTATRQRSAPHYWERRLDCQQLLHHTYIPCSPSLSHLDRIWSFKRPENPWPK